MALAKGRTAIAAQLVASGTTSAVDVSASYGQTLYLRHSNGTGTVTTAATMRVQVKPTGGTFVDLGVFSGSLVAGQVDSFPCRIPDDAAAVQVVYTAPTGPTGFTLDAEVGTITSL